ncbi:MAG: hypothetical protein ACYCOU_11235 [Sulfobacillus sp.]
MVRLILVIVSSMVVGAFMPQLMHPILDLICRSTAVLLVFLVGKIYFWMPLLAAAITVVWWYFHRDKDKLSFSHTPTHVGIMRLLSNEMGDYLDIAEHSLGAIL